MVYFLRFTSPLDLKVLCQFNSNEFSNSSKFYRLKSKSISNSLYNNYTSKTRLYLQQIRSYRSSALLSAKKVDNEKNKNSSQNTRDLLKKSHKSLSETPGDSKLKESTSRYKKQLSSGKIKNNSTSAIDDEPKKGNKSKKDENGAKEKSNVKRSKQAKSPLETMGSLNSNDEHNKSNSKTAQKDGSIADNVHNHNEPILLERNEFKIFYLESCQWPIVGEIITLPVDNDVNWYVVFPPTTGKLFSNEVESLKRGIKLKSDKIVWAIYATPIVGIESFEKIMDYKLLTPVINMKDKERAPYIISDIRRALYICESGKLDIAVPWPTNSNSIYLQFAMKHSLSFWSISGRSSLLFGTEPPSISGVDETSEILRSDQRYEFPGGISDRLQEILIQIKSILNESKAYDSKVHELLPLMNFNPKNILEASDLVDKLIFAILNETDSLSFFYPDLLTQTNVIIRARFFLSNIREVYVRDKTGLTPNEKSNVEMDIWKDLINSDPSGIQKIKESYESKLEKLPENVVNDVRVQIQKLNPSSFSEYISSCKHLDFIFSLPWNNSTEDILNMGDAKKHLDKYHYGMDEVKNHIMELLAVHKLTGNFSSGKILCLIGPPGTGKTTITKSIADSFGRRFGQISIGGLWDIGDIKGHRRSYLGSMPGLILKTISRLDSNNPVILLDEIDKLVLGSQVGTNLLEILDPQQQNNFTDNWLDLPFDISNVIFICTANYIENIHPALKDRLEFIELNGYFESEKFHIVKKHLVPKSLKQAGLKKEQFSITDAAIVSLIRNYDPISPGVRNLEKIIQSMVDKCGLKICIESSNVEQEKIEDHPENLKPETSENSSNTVRIKSKTKKNLTFHLTIRNYQNYIPKEAHKFESKKVSSQPGCVNALTTDLQSIECVAYKPKDKTGAFHTTGNIGDVMNESASIAYTFISNLVVSIESKVMDPGFFIKNSIHLHYPRGGEKKDGCLAGAATALALFSLAIGKPVPIDYVVSGELSLLGYVLPSSDIKSKIRILILHDIKHIILSKENQVHWNEIPDSLKKGITPHFVSWFYEIPNLLWNTNVPISSSIKGIFKYELLPSQNGENNRTLENDTTKL